MDCRCLDTASVSCPHLGSRYGGSMDQTLSHYKIFYTVAREKNISRAAQELYISQPAISKSIRKLEEALGVTLFIRSSRGVRLTEEGALLYEHVKEAFAALSLGEERIRQVTELGMGHLRIGVSTTLCRYMLLPYLKPFIRQHPHIQISIECQSSNHTLRLLREGKIDLGLVARPESPGSLGFYPLGEIEDIFVATREYLQNLSLRSDQTLEDRVFSDATLMLLDRENMTRQYIDDYLQEHPVSSGNILEVTTMDLLIEFAKIGLGVACVIREFVKEELQLGTLTEIPLGFPIHKREVGVICSSSSHYNGAAAEFLKSLKLL